MAPVFGVKTKTTPNGHNAATRHRRHHRRKTDPYRGCPYCITCAKLRAVEELRCFPRKVRISSAKREEMPFTGDQHAGIHCLNSVQAVWRGPA